MAKNIKTKREVIKSQFASQRVQMAVVPFPPNINYPVEEMPIESSRTHLFNRNTNTRMTSNPWTNAVGM